MKRIREGITRKRKSHGLSEEVEEGSKGFRNLVGLTKEEIDIRKAELRKNIPTYPGIKYLEERVKKFQVQPWPFISYLAYWAPERLKGELGCYKDYDGAENYFAIIEQLKENHIIWELISDLKKEHPNEF